MFRWSVLLLALALSTPAMWSAFVADSMSVTTAAIRFLIAVPVAAVMLAVLRITTAGHHSKPAAGLAAQQQAAQP
jgi:hypothetical protein